MKRHQTAVHGKGRKRQGEKGVMASTRDRPGGGGAKEGGTQGSSAASEARIGRAEEVVSAAGSVRPSRSPSGSNSGPSDDASPRRTDRPNPVAGAGFVVQQARHGRDPFGGGGSRQEMDARLNAEGRQRRRRGDHRLAHGQRFKHFVLQSASQSQRRHHGGGAATQGRTSGT